MEGGESIFDSVFSEESLEDIQDVEMLDVEEGELIETSSLADLGQSSGRDVDVVDQGATSKNRRRKNNKRKNKRKRANAGPNVTDINRFVLSVCKRLKERKSYLVWTAVGCLGVSALSDLITEVDAIQACGGQKTADGRRFRNGGGILWNILKIRDPNTYKEIMTKGKEFEKQFKQQNIKEAPNLMEVSSQIMTDSADQATGTTVLDGSQPVSQAQNVNSDVEKKRLSVHDRIRMPVSYDDLLGKDDTKDELA